MWISFELRLWWWSLVAVIAAAAHNTTHDSIWPNFQRHTPRSGTTYCVVVDDGEASLSCHSQTTTKQNKRRVERKSERKLSTFNLIRKCCWAKSLSGPPAAPHTYLHIHIYPMCDHSSMYCVSNEANASLSLVRFSSRSICSSTI